MTHCGAYVPTPDERRGVERVALALRHPNVQGKRPLPEEVFAPGATLDLPPGTPRTYPPYGGATRRWSERSRHQVIRIRRKAPGIVCATYFQHGRTGEHFGIDCFVAPFRQKANRAQEAFGDALTEWLIRNWSEMHINYIIWWNWMNDGAGWFDYTPYSKPANQGGWPGGDPDQNTRRHEDHIHVQIMNPRLAPNQ